MDDATRAQTNAADPATSTWLAANAGSGKTRVLTDRVARMLLNDVSPERILCLTYTKAAAMEMQNRLFKQLGAWAMADDADLRDTLTKIGVDGATLDADLLAKSRTLFARAIEAPGGLKIQTIHSFCGSVLRRFPLEAGVSPAFTEIDERVQKRLILDLLDELAETPKGQDALALVAPHISDDEGLVYLSRAVAGKAEALEQTASWRDICASMGIDPHLTEADVVGAAITPDDRNLADRLIPHFDPTPRSSTRSILTVFQSANWTAPNMRDQQLLEGALLTGKDAKSPFSPKIDGIGNKALRTQIGADNDLLNDLITRVADARTQRVALFSAIRTHALHRFADLFLPAYTAAKQARGWLDFDDLIRLMNRLLADPNVAQWVLFRLDGGIDHILVDEAQDTSPDQWRIIWRLAEEFAAGEGARANTPRTIFVVGDKKQSIYSFQGADPAEFDRMREDFRTRLADIGAPFQPDAQLLYSFRSAPPILRLVDDVAHDLGAPGLGGDVEHKAFAIDRPGRVDLWPHIAPTQTGADPEWDDPQDLISDDHHSAILAETLAEQIKAMLAKPPLIKGKPLNAGDILILVRRRSPLFHKIIAKLKAAHIPVAGVDRSQLTTPLAVKDLLALCRFLATPEDDLSLAACLRSPLFGLSEDALFRLAHGRKGHLWEALRHADDAYSEPREILKDMRDKAEFRRPYDLLERMLIRHDGRRRLVARLGPEAEDAIDALLAQALAYERNEVPSLTGFIGWLESDDVQVKRDLSKADGQVRVMTVHGAKGLEAPVVILPDCAAPRKGGSGVKLLQPEGTPVVWAPSSADQTDAIRADVEARDQREREEANRLLYVALTRAESWLIVAAAGSLGDSKKPASSWYKVVKAAMEGMGADALNVRPLEGTGLRIETGDWVAGASDDPQGEAKAVLPDWAFKTAPRPAHDVDIRTPSDLGGAKALPGMGDDSQAAMDRGTLTHLLLEHLPRLPEAAWRSAAPGILALGPSTDLDTDPILEEATQVLTAPHLAAVFAPETLAEVEITAPSPALGTDLLGVIDRLIVTETKVTAIDFKTNATVPNTPNEVPEGLLRQMGAYAEMLGQVYPDREIEVALLWSRTATLIVLPHDIVSAALERARGA